MKKTNLIIATLISSILLCSCFPSEEITNTENNVPLSNIRTNEFVEEKMKSIKETLTIADNVIQGTPSEHITINITNNSCDNNLEPLNFKYHSFSEKELEGIFTNPMISATYRNDSQIKIREDVEYENYNIISITTDRDKIISGAGWVKYTTSESELNDLNLLVSYNSTNIRDDIDDIYSRNLPFKINTNDYLNNANEILSTLNIKCSSEPSVYYLDKETLSYRYETDSNEAKHFDNDYLLICYNDFSYNNIKIYNSPVQWTYSGAYDGTSFYMLINADNNQIVYFKGNGLFDINSVTPISSPQKTISLLDAVCVATHEYTQILTPNDIQISNAYLNYIPVKEDAKIIWIPCWIIESNQSVDIWNEKNNEYYTKTIKEKKYINALNGKVMR